MFLLMEPYVVTQGGTPARDVYTVSRLNREARTLLETGFPTLWIEGEISNLARPSSGHVYFSLKDNQAQVRCALFRMQLRQLRLEPKDGMQVQVRARVSLYEERGDFQLIVEYLEEAGEGALRRAFEALKLRLAKEGLFDASRKKPLPRLPKRIGLITSSSGAVLHDILRTLERRFPAIKVLLYPVPVQGEGAAEKIAAAIRLADQRKDCDALILARGGGSLEDLWAFNEEIVGRALDACSVPLVCGVGHETDFTIADWVADARAPTPTAAAELLSPNQQEWLTNFRGIEMQLTKLIRDRLRQLNQHLDWQSARIVHPAQRIQLIHHRLQALAQRLYLIQTIRAQSTRSQLIALTARLRQNSPSPRLHALQLHGRHLSERLQNGVARYLESAHQRLQQIAQTLHALSPLATLERGYAIVRRPATGVVLRDSASVKSGERIHARLARGALDCVVEKTYES
ncbi:MAG: exodeoxyribonuclease VII large subunit [Gammaproteobacteria bacterium]|nr:MAG: exodeoxyribonuclease VII large subunit [Gammaproteobacteria bacterium]